MTEFHFKSALEISSAIKNKEISAVEALRHFVARMEKHNPRLNAIIQTNLETAEAEALQADTAIASGENLGPLHGVPMTVKESFNVKGLPTTWGDPAFQNNIAEENALAVERFQSAGAIIFGKTNVPLMLADLQSFNAIYGTTHNPWKIGVTPGGSSGGAASALASGMTGLEVGSDIGSSIRCPAHFCGVYGHKPTYGVLPPRGHSLPGTHAFTDISVIGPLARSASDLEVAFKALAGPETTEAIAWTFDAPQPRTRKIKDLRVAFVSSSPTCETDGEYGELLQNLIDWLGRKGAHIDDRARPDLDMVNVHQTYVTMLRAATSARQPAELIEKNLREVSELQQDDNSYYATMARGNVIRHKDWLGLNNERMRMRSVWQEFFKNWDVLLCPVASAAAFEQNEKGPRWERPMIVNGKEVPQTDQLFWAGYNGLPGLPGTSAPIGLTRSGLPVGVQIVAPFLEDLTGIELAKMLEREYQSFQAPPGY
ncbi:MAG: amidase [Rhodospirillales bacterium]